MLKSQNFKESGSLLIDKCSKLFEVWHDDFNQAGYGEVKLDLISLANLET